MNTFIYALRDSSSDEVRYVGQTFEPASRLRSHRRDVAKTVHDDNPKRLWVEETIDAGLVIDMVILEECDIDSAHVRELHWLNYYKDAGHRLTNSAVPCRSKIVTALRENQSSIKMDLSASDMGAVLAIADAQPYLQSVDDIIRYSLHYCADNHDVLAQIRKELTTITSKLTQ